MTRNEVIDMLKRCLNKSSVFVYDPGSPDFKNGSRYLIDNDRFLAALEEERQEDEEKNWCSVCHEPAKKIMGTCVCIPSHGFWHIECDPHREKENTLGIPGAIKNNK